MRFLAVIPARGGSKGIPHKNIALLNGKPLIQYTIEAAQAVFAPEDICLSTDDEAIIEVAAAAGLPAPFRRPASLATDTATTYDVLVHALSHYTAQGIHYDGVVLLQPTSPLRTGQHIEEALAAYTPDVDMVVSVKETDSNPYYVLFEEDALGYLQPSKPSTFTRRQDCPTVWEYNGAVYVINAISLRNNGSMRFSRIKKYVMDAASSIDIDAPLDMAFAEWWLREGKARF